MRGNYHNIKAIISNSHNFSEIVYGITSYTQGLFKANVIKIKNTVTTKLSLKSKCQNNVIQITTKTVDTSLKIAPKLDINNFIVKNSVLNKIVKALYTSNTALIIKNTLWIYIAKIAEIKNLINISNNIKHSVVIPKKDNNNSVVIDDNVDISIRSISRVVNNEIKIENPPVNSSAWYFLKLGNMSGTLGEVSTETLETYGRKKVI